MIKAMVVVTANKHPNADRLRVYTLTSYDGTDLQVCANLTNIYQEDDIVAVCQEGHDCGDFTIASRKVRGVLSQGMMLGVVDAIPGQDVTDLYSAFEF